MPFVKFGSGVAHISIAGPEREIQVRGKRWRFEMHPYFGPAILKRNGDPAAAQPIYVMEAISLWAQQGERMDGDLCQWDHPPKEILKHLRGKQYKLVGYEEPIRGE